MDFSFDEHLFDLGLKYKAHKLVGKGGQLATYLVDVFDDLSGNETQLIVKHLRADRNLAATYGYEPISMLEKEVLYTELMNAHGMGPALLSFQNNVIIREYLEAKPFSNIVRECSQESLINYFEKSLLFLEQTLKISEENNLQGYIDFNCSNILVDDQENFLLVDHEWAILQYKNHEDLCVNTIYKYFRSFVKHQNINFDILLEIAHTNKYLSVHIPRVKAQIVAGYFNVNDTSYQKALTSFKELPEQLTQYVNSSPKQALEKLLTKLDLHSIRYCFARRYDFLFDGQPYKEKDVDLYVHPDDFHSFILIAQEVGFTLYNLTKFLCYCNDTASVVFLDVVLGENFGEHSAFDVCQIIERSERKSDVYIISEIDLFVHVITNAILQNKNIKDKYQDFLFNFLQGSRGDVDWIDGAFGAVFGAEQSKRILKYVKVKDWQNINSTLNPKATIDRDLTDRFKDYSVTGPRLIGLLGVDGAGKSTTAKSVKNALMQAGLNSKDYYLGCYYPPSGRGQSFVLPTDWLMVMAYKILQFAKKLKIAPKKIISSKPSVQKYRAEKFEYDESIDSQEWKVPLEPGGECDSIIFRIYAWILVLDCVLMGARLRLVQGYNFVFTDRYFYDLLTFLGKDHILSRFLARNFKPDAALFLYASAQVQAQREPRHPLSEIRTNQEIYRFVPKLNPDINWHEISTELPPSVVAQRVLFCCMTAERQRSGLKFISNFLLALYRKLRLEKLSLK